MKNKFLLLLLAFTIFMPASYSSAIQMKVSAINEFKTDAPSKTINVSVREDIMLGQYSIHAGDKLLCNVLEVTDPKRGKQNAGIYVQPVSYTSSGKTILINDEYIGKYSKTVLSKEEIMNMPKLGLVKKAAVTVGSFYIKGLSQGVSLAEGIVRNEDGNRLKSGVKQVYEDSPLSYVEKGSELDIMPGDDFYLVFKHEEPDEDEKPNYSYTAPVE